MHCLFWIVLVLKCFGSAMLVWQPFLEWLKGRFSSLCQLCLAQQAALANKWRGWEKPIGKFWMMQYLDGWLCFTFLEHLHITDIKNNSEFVLTLSSFSWIPSLKLIRYFHLVFPGCLAYECMNVLSELCMKCNPRLFSSNIEQVSPISLILQKHSSLHSSRHCSLVSSMLQSDPKRSKHSLVSLVTVPYSPSVWNGFDEGYKVRWW